MDNEELGLHLRQLEEELISEAARKNPQRLNELLAEEYMEIGKSGKVYNKAEVIEGLKNETYRGIEITGYKITFLADTAALAVYTAHHMDVNNGFVNRSYRSSIWKLAHNRWQIIFHQGTLVAD